MATSVLDAAKLPSKKRSIREPTQEDHYYMRKIEELANERLILYRIYERELKERREQKAALIRCPPSTSTGEDDRKQKMIERLLFFRRQKELREEQVKEREKSKAVPSTSTGEDDRKNKKKKKKKIVRRKHVRTPVVNNEVTQRLKEFIVKKMKGTELKLVIQKRVYESDTRKSLNRLNMPVHQLENNEFLTDEEKRIVNDRYGKENGIEVPLLGPTLEMYEDKMKLKMWHMSTSLNYVLTTNWHRFWKENEAHLAQRSKIQVWSFRRDDQLCFAVARVGKPDD